MHQNGRQTIVCKESQHDTHLNQTHNANRVPQISNNALMKKAKSGKDETSSSETFPSDAHAEAVLFPHVQVGAVCHRKVEDHPTTLNYSRCRDLYAAVR